MSDKIQFRRGTAAQLAAVTLSVGEPAYITDTKRLYVGDGTTNQGIVSSAPTTATWIAPTLLNGWVNFGESQAIVGYYKDDLGMVHLKGFIKSGTAASGTVIFHLPGGYRPFEIMTYSTGSNGAYGQIYVKDNGDVVFDVGSNVFFSLNIPAFRAEQ
jgi:hypothetical protein